MAQLQELHQHNRYTRKHLLFLGISLLLLISGAIVWVLNIISFLTGPWSNILLVQTIINALRVSVRASGRCRSS